MAINAINLIEMLGRQVGYATPLGYPFPGSPLTGEQPKIATGFQDDEDLSLKDQYDVFGTPVVKVTDANLGKYEFKPVFIDNGLIQYELPNPLIMIRGEKGVIETDVLDRGVVFEKVFERPYDISILIQLFDPEHKWPAQQFKDLADLYRGQYTYDSGVTKTGFDLVTLRCALTNPFLQPESNFLITKFSLLDNGNAENMEVIQIDGRSNIDFELIIK